MQSHNTAPGSAADLQAKLASLHARIAKERKILEGFQAMRAATNNQDVIRTCEAKIRESGKTIGWFEESVRELEGRGRGSFDSGRASPASQDSHRQYPNPPPGAAPSYQAQGYGAQGPPGRQEARDAASAAGPGGQAVFGGKTKVQYTNLGAFFALLPALVHLTNFPFPSSFFPSLRSLPFPNAFDDAPELSRPSLDGSRQSCLLYLHFTSSGFSAFALPSQIRPSSRQISSRPTLLLRRPRSLACSTSLSSSSMSRSSTRRASTRWPSCTSLTATRRLGTHAHIVPSSVPRLTLTSCAHSADTENKRVESKQKMVLLNQALKRYKTLDVMGELGDEDDGTFPFSSFLPDFTKLTLRFPQAFPTTSNPTSVAPSPVLSKSTSSRLATSPTLLSRKPTSRNTLPRRSSTSRSRTLLEPAPTPLAPTDGTKTSRSTSTRRTSAR